MVSMESQPQNLENFHSHNIYPTISAMCTASQLPGKGPTDVDDAPYILKIV